MYLVFQLYKHRTTSSKHIKPEVTVIFIVTKSCYDTLVTPDLSDFVTYSLLYLKLDPGFQNLKQYSVIKLNITLPATIKKIIDEIVDSINIHYTVFKIVFYPDGFRKYITSFICIYLTF